MFCCLVFVLLFAGGFGVYFWLVAFCFSLLVVTLFAVFLFGFG